MRVVVQRVSRAEVRTAETDPARIGRGFLLLVGLARDDTDRELSWMAAKIAGLRVFADDEGRMNKDLRDVGGDCLAVSQFTLLGDARKGRRPSFVGAMAPDAAADAFRRFVGMLEDTTGRPVPTGVFGAHMDVELLNDGPVTLILETANVLT